MCSSDLLVKVMNPNAEQKTVELITEPTNKDNPQQTAKPKVEKTIIQVDEPHPIEPSVDWTEASKGVDETIRENSEQAETSSTVEKSVSETQSKETLSKEAATKENLNEAS